jgi:membrane associated rhomboid family serine protease
VYFFFFFPIGTDSRKPHPPVGTTILLLVMTALFATRYLAPSVYIGLISRSFLPASPHWSGAVLSLFLHGSWMHLLGNALYVWIFGRQLEGRLGFAMLALIFFIGGVASCWFHAWLAMPSAANVPLVGASGAVAALLGATVIRFHHQRVRILFFLFAFLGGMTRGGIVHLNTVLACGLWFVLQIAYGLAATESGGGGVAYAAHAGGFVSGLVLSLLVGLQRDVKKEVHFQRGQRYFEKGDFHAAAGEMTSHLRYVPGDAEAAAMRARCFILLGRRGEAASEYLRLFREARRNRDIDRAARLYGEIRRYGLGSNLSESGLLRMAFDFQKGGRVEEAAEVFLEVTNRFPSGPKAELALVRRAEILWNHLGSCESAGEGYRRLLEDYPDSEWADLADARLRSMRALSGQDVRAPWRRPDSRSLEWPRSARPQ